MHESLIFPRGLYMNFLNFLGLSYLFELFRQIFGSLDTVAIQFPTLSTKSTHLADVHNSRRARRQPGKTPSGPSNNDISITFPCSDPVPAYALKPPHQT